jgi:hypothetical protein
VGPLTEAAAMPTALAAVRRSDEVVLNGSTPARDLLAAEAAELSDPEVPY